MKRFLPVHLLITSKYPLLYFSQPYPVNPNISASILQVNSAQSPTPTGFPHPRRYCAAMDSDNQFPPAAYSSMCPMTHRCHLFRHCPTLQWSDRHMFQWLRSLVRGEAVIFPRPLATRAKSLAVPCRRPTKHAVHVTLLWPGVTRKIGS